MNKIDKILQEVIKDAKSVGIPISNNINKNVFIDKRRYDRIAACYEYEAPRSFVIHMSEKTLKANNKTLRDVLMHEIIHTCYFSMEHDGAWSAFKDVVNQKLGYNVQEDYYWSEVVSK